ncbi:MAG: hypothetical protein ACR2GY_05880 [Phycisphaerales bacterium]
MIAQLWKCHRTQLVCAGLVIGAGLSPCALAQIEPGNGWLSSTNTPGSIGHPGLPGYTARVIARWDVVPFQTITEPFEVGVVAFHMNGIDRVEIGANGGPWVSVTQPRLNPRTDVVEYFATLDPSDFPDGVMELRARIIPATAGQPLVLQGPIDTQSPWSGIHSMYLTGNGGGSIPTPTRYVATDGNDTTGRGTQSRPFKTIFRAALDIQEDYGRADGGRIILAAGDYDWGPSFGAINPVTSIRWLTIEAAEGATRSSVRIRRDHAGGLKTALTHLKNLTVFRTSISAPGSSDNAIWIDGCVMDGGGRGVDQFFLSPTVYERGILYTGTRIQNVEIATNGSTFARDVLIEDIGADAFKNARLVLNSEVRNIDNRGIVAHPDVAQYHGTDFDNVIIFGLWAVDRIDAQGLFSRRAGVDGTFNNSAFVNYVVKTTEHNGQWQQTSDHLLFWHFVHLVRPFAFRDDSGSLQNGLFTRLTNLSIRNSVFNSLLYETSFGPSEQELADNCHFERLGTYGTNATEGDPMFEDEDAFLFYPSADSPLRGRVGPIIVPYDLHGTPVSLTRSIGAIQPPDDGNNQSADLLSVTTVIGQRIDGNLASLLQSDNAYYVGQSAYGFSSSSPHVLEIQVRGRFADPDPSEMSVSVESRMNNPSGRGTVRLFNLAQNRYETVWQGDIHMNDATAFVGGIPAGSYTDASGRFTVRIKHVAVATFSVEGFRSYFDNVRAQPN